jgi:hypothetical protein
VKRFACILIVALVGCGKKPAPAPPQVTEQVDAPPPVAASRRSSPIPAPETPSSPAATPKPSVSIQDQLQGTVHPEMTMRLRMFEQMKGRMPQSFYELQNMGGFDSTPGLPPNMRYEIDPRDKTVKIVKK